MQEQKQQLLTRLKESTNVLVTVSNNPTADQLVAAIGLTLALDKQKKHATAVFSGEVPSMLEFLEPEKTIKKNTDSLRDFIISLDRDKADKLRYKVEDKVVKIFISPYKTAIRQEDLVFSQGDFNIDVVVAIGVKEQEDLDSAITAHGRILHDATVATVNTSENGTVGSIHWINQQASSLSEMISELTLDLNKEVLDSQIATALLTGIVAETDRFSNDKTKPNTLATSSKLMAAGANQQLVSSKLEEAKQLLLAEQEKEAAAEEPPPEPAPEPPPEKPQADVDDSSMAEVSHNIEDGVLKINHDDKQEGPDTNNIHIDEEGRVYNEQLGNENSSNKTNNDASTQSQEPAKNDHLPKPKPVTYDEPSAIAASVYADKDSGGGHSDPLYGDDETAKRNNNLFHGSSASDESKEQTDTGKRPENKTIENQTTTNSSKTAEIKKDEAPIEEGTRTLADIEKSVGAHQQTKQTEDQQTQTGGTPPPQPSTAAQQQPSAELDQARQTIIDSTNEDPKEDPKQGSADKLPPVEALNAQPVHLDLHSDDSSNQQAGQSSPQVDNPNQPPSVPPPMMPPSDPPNNTPPANPS